jgi:transposase
MHKVPVFVGLDYHQRSIQVCVMDRAGKVLANRSCSNQWLEVVRIAERHGDVRRVAIESCTGAANLAELLLQEAGWSVDLAHPGYVRRMKQNPDKSDYTDARMLADLTRVGYLPRVWLAPHDVRELRRLVRYRQQLVNERRAIKLRITATLREQRIVEPPVRRWSVVWHQWFEQCPHLSEQSRWIADRQLTRLWAIGQEVQAVMKRLGQVTAEDAIVQKLLTLSGVGPVTALTLRAEIGRFDRFVSGKQLSRFCGVSPRNASSGQRQADAGLIKAANGQLRAVMIEAAHRLARLDPRWSVMAGQMREAGKPGSVVAAAVANRWLRWLFHQMQPASLAA